MVWWQTECKFGDMIRVSFGNFYHYGIFVSEAEVVACHQPAGLIFPGQHQDKILPGHGHHLFVKGLHDHLIDGEDPFYCFTAWPNITDAI